jgi:hypothetical protein
VGEGNVDSHCTKGSWSKSYEDNAVSMNVKERARTFKGVIIQVGVMVPSAERRGLSGFEEAELYADRQDNDIIDIHGMYLYL